MRMLIANIHMKVGGNRSSLINLLKNIDLKNHEVDVFLFTHDEEAKRELSEIKGVRLLKEPYLLSMVYTPYKTYARKKDILRMTVKTVVSALIKMIGTKRTLMLVMLFQRRLGYYDAAISFAHDKWIGGFYGGCNDFVNKKVRAGRKIAWIHNDPTRLGFTEDICEKTYKGFDRIVCVSQACKEKIDEIAPGLMNRSAVVYNMFGIDEIRHKSVECNPYDYEGFKIVTVARMFNLQKRIDRAVECCKMLKNQGISGFRWYIVGDGQDFKWLRGKVAEEGLQDIIVFTGYKSNPYPYMRLADVLVLTSEYEAHGMVLTESIIAGTPVIVTGYREAGEFVKDNLNGIITANSTEGVYAAVKDVLLNKDKLDTFREYIANQELSNDAAIEQFWSVLRH
jgi:glycosyltransferase involved in cell wall biosynthesis